MKASCPYFRAALLVLTVINDGKSQHIPLCTKSHNCDTLSTRCVSDKANTDLIHSTAVSMLAEDGNIDRCECLAGFLPDPSDFSRCHAISQPMWDGVIRLRASIDQPMPSKVPTEAPTWKSCEDGTHGCNPESTQCMSTQDSREQAEGLRLQSFTFMNEGPLGMNLEGNLIVGVQGHAEQIGIEVNDRIIYVDGEPAAERVDELGEQLKTLPRPGVVIIRRGWTSMVVTCPCLDGFEPDPSDPTSCKVEGSAVEGNAVADTEDTFRVGLKDPMLVAAVTEKGKSAVAKTKGGNQWVLRISIGGSVLVVVVVAVAQGWRARKISREPQPRVQLQGIILASLTSLTDTPITATATAML
jgi:hypothetical protein